jgi:16S rRNA (adenine1518-N6/adenine1519-N6)-dimethyltransferase
MVLLVQKEVAERVCAKPGDMSTLSVSVQLYGKPEIIDIVKKESFFPSPKVDSAILKISDIQDPFDSLSLAQDDTKILSKEFFRLVHIGFASRRKTLVNNLSAGYRIPKEEASDIIKTIGLSDTVRAQELSIKNWRKLCQKMSQSHN